MNIIKEIRQSWGWIGIKPSEVVGENEFGNLIVRDLDGKYWRICPEDCSCKVVAEGRTELDRLSTDQEFLHDWYMRRLVSLASEQCGALAEGRKYCLKIPAALGGGYVSENLATAPLIELVRFSGDVARQIRDIPDGSTVNLKFVD